MWIYLLIAFVLLPVFVPSAVAMIETSRRRRLLMAPFIILGVVVAAILLSAMIHGPVTVMLRPYHLSYGLHVHGAFYIIAAYVTSVCATLLLSSDRHVVLFGLINVVAIAVIAKLTVDGFASVWCGWAAISSGAIAAHMRFARPHRDSPYVLA